MSQRIMYRKIKFPHFDAEKYDDVFYNMFKNTSDDFKSEIHDIYFGKFFRYNYEGKEKRYGNAMGVEASDAQIDNLFKIHDEYNIPLCLTLNSLETPHELLDDKSLLDQLIDFIGSFYKRGLRHCILASNHIIRSKILHKEFPDMYWENTVNQKIMDAQTALDYIFNGYNILMLDRSLNRNLKELKRIKKAVDYYNKKYKPDKKVTTCLLVSETCINNCPFKKEHDSVGEYIGADYFKGLSNLSCDNWRFTDFGLIPRNGVDIVASTKETWQQFSKLTDCFKFSGRFTEYNYEASSSAFFKMVWLYVEHHNINKVNSNSYRPKPEELIYSNTFSEIIENNLSPIHTWIHGHVFIDLNDYKSKMNIIENTISIWKTEKGKRLEKILMNCRSQCWDCHECEIAFNTRKFDSGLQINENY